MAFLWVTHQVPVTRWVKSEVAANAPELRFAFSRPGLTTFKAEGTPAWTAQVPTSFARAWGVSLGRAESVEQVVALAAPHLGGPLRLHVFERDLDVPVDEQDQAVRGTRAAAVEQQLRAVMPGLLPEPRARIGDRVLDVVVPHAAEPDEPWLVGMHEHDANHGPWPGGVPYVPAPPEAPSRAWSKIEEALRWADLEPRPGEIAVELGSSPGGASRALLDRGLMVYGVDPGEMDPRVLASDRFVHLQLPAAEVPKRALPRSYEWLALDVNLAPMIALRYVERFVALAHGGLRGAVLTLKINDDGIFEALPRLYERIGKLGASSVRVTQLPSHRSEVVAILTWG
jgi:23S rRNA (cytidine2498-2'-O)-methyltransferase